MKQRSRTEYSFLNIYINLLGYGINLILSFVCRMIFARLLAPEYLGISGLFSNILSMLSLTELGVGTAIVYALYKPIAQNDREKITAIMQFYGKAYKLIGCSVAVFGLCLLPFLDYIIGQQPAINENLKVIYLLYLFNSASSYFFSYRSTILTASQRNYIVTTINYLMVIVQDIVQIVILFITQNFMLYLIIQIICGLITNILISEKAKKDYPYITEKNSKHLSKDEIREIAKNVKALTVTKLSGILVNNTDNIVITYFNGLVTTGASSNYTLLTGMLSTMLNLVFGSVSASVGSVNATENNDTKYKVFKALNLASFWLYGWATVGIIVVSGDVIKLLFGNQYVLNESIPIVLAINFFMVGMQSIVLNYKSTMGLFKYGQYLLLVTAGINIAGDIILAPYFGVFGIFFATTIARLVTNVWYDPYAVFKYGLQRNVLDYFKIYVKYLLVLLAATLVSYDICRSMKLMLVPQIIVSIVICSIVFNVIFLFMFRKKEEFLYLKDKCMNHINKIRDK